MMFFAYALMEISVWISVTVSVIHFDRPSLYWFAILGSFLLPSFKQFSDKKDRKPTVDDNNTIWIDE